MIKCQQFSTDPSVFEWTYVPSIQRHVTIPKVPDIDTLRMVIFKDQDIQISYEAGESYVFKKYIVESDEMQQFVDTSLDIFRGGLGVTAKKLQIFIQGDRRFQVYVPLASRVHQQLRDFVLRGPPIPAFCCVDFVQKLFDKYVPQLPHTFEEEKWKFFRCTQKTPPKAGEAVALANERSRKLFRHFAFCLGQGLYLSVAGDGGPLVVTDLEELQNLYKARSVFVISPRKRTKRQPMIGGGG